MNEASRGLKMENQQSDTKMSSSFFNSFKRKGKICDGKKAFFILAPIFLYLSIVAFIPILLVLFLSFTEWNGIQGLPKFIGIKNYIRYLSEPFYRSIIWQTFYISIIGLSLNVFIGLFVALLLNQKIMYRGVFRTIWYLPVVTSYAIISQMLLVVINPMNGIANRALGFIGIQPIIWQHSTFWMIFWITLLSVWKAVGQTVVYYLAGLQSIDDSLYEAASVDGASKLKKFTKITLPMLTPMTVFVLINGIVTAFQQFEAIMFISKGGPNNSTNVLLYQIYTDAFKNFSMGMASVGSCLVLGIVLALSILSIRLGRNYQI